MYDFNFNEFHDRRVFCLDAAIRIHPIPAYRYDRLQAGYPDAALPQLAGQRVCFATFHVIHRSADPLGEHSNTRDAAASLTSALLNGLSFARARLG